MFDVGFWEIALIAIITLLVVGPERMPAVARQAGASIGKLKRFLNDAGSEVKAQLEQQEIGELKQHLSIEDKKNSILDVLEGKEKKSVNESNKN